MTKGYKATHNYKCRNQIYEIGQEYKLDYTPIICERGFHYCLDAKDTMEYYSYTHEFKLLEIEDLNPTDTEIEDDKSCSNYIRIIREITDKEELLQLLDCFYTFDKNGKISTFETSDGVWSEYTFNEKGQEVIFRNSSGYWRKHTYDKFGNLLTYKSSSGFWREYTYDEFGQQLTFRSFIK